MTTPALTRTEAEYRLLAAAAFLGGRSLGIADSLGPIIGLSTALISIAVTGTLVARVLVFWDEL